MKKTLLLLITVMVSYSTFAQQFLPTSSINAAGSANSFTGGYTFAYATSGTPWNGALLSVGGFTNTYDLQLNSDYNLGGVHLSFRTHNGDTHVLNPWNEIFHTGNLNRADVDFTAKTINSANVYNNGNLWSKQINVALANPWADYVFSQAYNLPSLGDIKTYIDKNHHLPDVPSAAEVEKNGINLGEMNRVLVKKIEELTLYLIKKDNEDKEKDIRLSLLQEQINQLKQQLNTVTKFNNKN
jgi:hypothetical protein